MGRVLYTATMSLDGFIAGPGGDMAWLARFAGGGDKTVPDLVRRAGSVLVAVAPILLGDGTRLFDHPGGLEVDLERTRVERIATYLWFRVGRGGE